VSLFDITSYKCLFIASLHSFGRRTRSQGLVVSGSCTVLGIASLERLSSFIPIWSRVDWCRNEKGTQHSETII
jgi:hypothetical protein